MNFFKRSIAAKLWLAMVILVLVVTWSTGAAQSNIIKRIYYERQIENILRQAGDISRVVGTGENVREKIRLISQMAHANIMLVDREGYIEECHGMGMIMSHRRGGPDRINVVGHHGDLISGGDMGRILSGETVFKRGVSGVVNEEVLSVAVPVTMSGVVTGAVIVSHSVAAIEGQMYEYQRVIVNVGMGGIILATFLSLLFSRSLSGPLIQMNRVARGLARGDFSKKVEVGSEDEIGVLAESLNTLSGNLQEKIAALERLDQTRKDFVAGVSHELRTPLTIIQGYAEALQDGVAEGEEERRQCVRGIVEEAGRLRRIVNDLLDLRRIESGQESIELSVFDPAPVMSRTAKKIRPVAEGKNIGLVVDIPGKLPMALSNPDRLDQVLLNLLENAVRYTPAGGKVTVRAFYRDKAVRVTVTDSGPGISAGDMEFIWEKFYKADKSRSRSHGAGTGLGLAIVRRLVEKMGGNVGVESTPGKGSTFFFSLRADPHADCGGTGKG